MRIINRKRNWNEIGEKFGEKFLIIMLSHIISELAYPCRLRLKALTFMLSLTHSLTPEVTLSFGEIHQLTYTFGHFSNE